MLELTGQSAGAIAGASVQMENSRATPNRSAWNEIHVANAGRYTSLPGARRRSWIGTTLFIIVLASIHGSIALFGWAWIGSMRAQAPVNAPVQEKPPSVNEGTAIKPSKADYSGAMQWTKKGGLAINPKAQSQIRCAGNIPYTTRRNEDGSTTIEVLTANGKPARCENTN